MSTYFAYFASEGALKHPASVYAGNHKCVCTGKLEQDAADWQQQQVAHNEWPWASVSNEGGADEVCRQVWCPRPCCCCICCYLISYLPACTTDNSTSTWYLLYYLAYYALSRQQYAIDSVRWSHSSPPIMSSQSMCHFLQTAFVRRNPSLAVNRLQG